MENYQPTQEEVLDQPMSDKYTIVVEFFIEADAAEDAEAIVNELIMEGIVAIASEDTYEYDITSAEPTEVCR